jgi:hypothetical protein
MCLSQHGFAAAVGSAGSAPNKSLSIAGVIVSGNVDPSSPQFQAAMQACRKYLPGGGPPSLTPAQQAEWASAMAKFAACMRTNAEEQRDQPGLAVRSEGVQRLPIVGTDVRPSHPTLKLPQLEMLLRRANSADSSCPTRSS